MVAFSININHDATGVLKTGFRLKNEHERKTHRESVKTGRRI